MIIICRSVRQGMIVVSDQLTTVADTLLKVVSVDMDTQYEASIVQTLLSRVLTLHYHLIITYSSQCLFPLALFRKIAL